VLATNTTSAAACAATTPECPDLKPGKSEKEGKRIPGFKETLSADDSAG